LIGRQKSRDFASQLATDQATVHALCVPASPVKAVTLRSDEREKHAALTARTARRLAPPGRAFAFYASLYAVPLRSKNQSQRQKFSTIHQLSKQPAFELGQIVATPGALAALRKAGQQPGEFLTRHVNREWGDLSDEERKENDCSLEHGFRLHAAVESWRDTGHCGLACVLGFGGDQDTREQS
jgi:hypothetical protein